MVPCITKKTLETLLIIHVIRIRCTISFHSPLLCFALNDEVCLHVCDYHCKYVVDRIIHPHARACPSTNNMLINAVNYINANSILNMAPCPCGVGICPNYDNEDSNWRVEVEL